MKQIFFISLSILLLSGCASEDKSAAEDKPNMQRKLAKDFWLAWWDNKATQKITVGNRDAFDGYIIIDNTVFSVGCDSNFIIAKLHPDMQEEISNRFLRIRNTKGHFEIRRLADTIYLNKTDTIYRENNKWYHTNSTWTKPDSLKPYKAITYYHIIDIRNYLRGNWGDFKTNWDSYKAYSFDNEKDFMNKRLELGVPENLTFTITDQELQ